jgi:hypothetical protein
MVKDLTEYLISGFWQFSPCGDVIGLVTEPTLSSMNVTLYKTVSKQAALADHPVGQVASVALRADGSSHIASIGGADVTLAPNGAGSTCVVGPDSLILTPREVPGGGVSTGRVRLNAPAPSGGLTVSLSSSNTAAATVPATVVVPQDSLKQTFSVQSASVSSLTKVVISASANSMTARDTLTVVPLRLLSFTFNKATVTGGDNVIARFALSAEAPPGGSSIALRSSKPSLVAPPSTALVHAGQTSDSISIATAAVTVIDSAMISAIASGDTLKQTLRVYPPITLELIPDSVVGGNNVTFLVSRLDPAPAGGLVVPVVSSDSSLFVAPTLTIPEGSTSIWANDIPTKGVDVPTSVIVSTQAGSASLTAELRIHPALLASFGARTDSGCTIAEPGGFRRRFLSGCTILFEAALDGEAPQAGGVMTISSSRPDLIGPNPTLLLAGYDRKGLFSVQTTGGVSGAQEVVLTATYRGITKSDTVILMPGPHYTLTDISQTGSTGYNYQAINNAGEVLIDGVSLWRDGSYIRLDSLPGFRLTGVTGMNDSAWFIGTVWNAGQSLNEAAYWKPDTTIMLPSLDGSHPQGNTIAINNHGEVVGTSSATSYPFESIPVKWQSGAASALGAYLSYKLWPVAVNDTGEVIGSGSYYQASPYISRQIGVRWDKSGVASPLFHPWGIDFFIGGVGIAADGTALLAWPNQFYLERGGVFSPVFTPPPPHNRITPYDMNDSLDVVGEVRTYLEDVGTWYSSFVKRGGYVYDLRCLVDFPPAWTKPTATGINNSGTIVGWAEDGAEIRLFLLTPGGPTSVGDGRAQSRIPDDFRLMQNFPNPFNPSTVIRYDLPRASDVRIELFNLLGQRVLTLEEGWRSAGQYSVRLNGSELATGVYIYRMEAGEFTQSRKMVLVK